MADIKVLLGTAFITDKGTWAKDTVYETNDIVHADSGIYLSLVDSNYDTPGSSTNWRLWLDLAQVTKATQAANDAADAATKAAQNPMTKLIPTGMTVKSITDLTITNLEQNYIYPTLLPDGVEQNVVYISDNKAVEITPEGRICIVGEGASKVYVIPTCNTALAKVLRITVHQPNLRLGNTRSQFRFTSGGGLRFN